MTDAAEQVVPEEYRLAVRVMLMKQEWGFDTLAIEAGLNPVTFSTWLYGYRDMTLPEALRLNEAILRLYDEGKWKSDAGHILKGE